MSLKVLNSAMPFYSKVFRYKDGKDIVAKSLAPHADSGHTAPVKSAYTRSWSSKTITTEEVAELIHACTQEMKARAGAFDLPFLLLPYRPNSASTPNPAMSFIRDFFEAKTEQCSQYTGSALQQELRLTESEVLCSVLKWCWSRIPGGVVTWNVYELFRLGELDSGMATNAFNVFIPLCVDEPARHHIIVDFFDLLAAVAAHSTTNGLGGRRLSRMAGWYAFEQSDDGKGFEGGYKSWSRRA